MKRLRRILFVFVLIVYGVCIVLLLNFTASNPTGRRYSSQSVVVSGSAQNIGTSGERILSADLGVPRNEDAGQRQCICGAAVANGLIPTDCGTCVVYTPLVANYRRPDFVTPRYIAESKNRQNLLYTYADQVDQITEYAEAARVLNVPLWLFTRVDTVLSPEYVQIVEATGGGVVAYFAIPGYVDPIDTLARFGLVTSAGLIVIVIVWEGITRLPRIQPSSPKNPANRAHDKTQNAEDFLTSTREKLRSQNDKLDLRDDFDR